jgi:hypothetical protein
VPFPREIQPAKASEASFEARDTGEEGENARQSADSTPLWKITAMFSLK